MSGNKAEKAAALKRAKEDIEKSGGLKSNAVQHVIQDCSGETRVLTDLPELPVVHFKNCKDCEYTFGADAKVVKVLVEGCSNCRFALAGCMVLTATLEVWRCQDCEVSVDCELGTIQVDLCTALRLNFAKRGQMGSLVQAGVKKMTVTFRDQAHPPVCTGLDELRAAHPDDVINDSTDQYISRFVDGALLTERIVRLSNDFPTTTREKEVFDAQAAKKTEAVEKLAREMLGDKVGDLSLKDAVPQPVDDTSDEARGKFKKGEGNAAFQAGDFKQAAVYYTEAILAFDKDHAVFSNRAACFLKLGQADKALADCDRCLALSPRFVKALFRRGIALMGLNRFEDAAAAFSATLDADPKNADAKASLQMAQMKAACARQQA